MTSNHKIFQYFQKWFYLNELTYATEPPDEDDDY